MREALKIALSLLAGSILTACGPSESDRSEETASPHEDSSEIASEAPLEAVAEEAQEAISAALDEETTFFSELDPVAEVACQSEPSEIADIIPVGTSFSARGPDAIVVIACAFDGVREFWAIDSTQLPDDLRSEFDFTIAEHLRTGTRTGDDRSQSGLFRRRDGGSCAIQSDADIAISVCIAAENAQTYLDQN